jgi:hypothetical protein
MKAPHHSKTGKLKLCAPEGNREMKQFGHEFEHRISVLARLNVALESSESW